MTQPNWDKAPEDAEAYQPASPEQFEGWYRRKSGDVEWWQLDCAGKEQWVWMGGRKDFPYGAIPRPSVASTVTVGNQYNGLNLKKERNAYNIAKKQFDGHTGYFEVWLAAKLHAIEAAKPRCRIEVDQYGAYVIESHYTRHLAQTQAECAEWAKDNGFIVDKVVIK